MVTKFDPTKFKCYRFQPDGSLYFGEVAYLNHKTGAIAHTVDASLDEESRKQWKMIRHGYGLQLYRGQRNEDGVLTKYEGPWERDRKHGDSGLAVFKDGSIYTGGWKKDDFWGQGKFEWAIGHTYEGQWRDSQMDGAGLFIHSNGRQLKGQFKRNYFFMEKTFVNPLDDEKRQAKNIKVYEDQQQQLKSA